MSVNYYFQSGIPEEHSANQRLVEALTIEAIQIAGMDTYYMPRTLVDVDPILTEDALSKYEDAYHLEMYLENVQGFDGDGAMFAKFGIEMNDSCTFVVSRSRWEAEVGRKGTRLPRPIEGDLVYLPITKSYFEIKKVNGSNPFYQLGKMYVWKLECELYQFSHEVIDTGIAELDVLGSMFSAVNESHFLLMEDGIQLLHEDGSGVVMEFEIDDYDKNAQNRAFDDADDVLDFSEFNPFAEVDR